MKPTSNNMKKMYSEKRNSTLDKIQAAIDDIKADHRIVTKKELLELTGLSSGTFSQDHVKELLKSNEVCQYRNRRKVKTEKLQMQKRTLIDNLIIENQKLQSKIQDYQLHLDKKDKKYGKLYDQNQILTQEHLLLRGKYQQLLEYMDALGTDLSNMSLI